MSVLAVPTNSLVVTEWLKTLAPLGVNPALVGPSLPEDVSVWAADGFYQVVTVGGTPLPNLPVSSPVVSVRCWAANQSSTSAPMNRAEAMAQTLVRAAYRAGTQFLQVASESVFLLGVLPVSEPLRVPDPVTNYARADVQLHAWWGES